MKFLLLIFFCLLVNQSFAQNSLMQNLPHPNSGSNFNSQVYESPYLSFLNNNQGVKLISVNTSNVYFQKSYLIDKNGNTMSAGFMPTSYFLPNDNFLVISGQNNQNRDSFNPYGASDISSLIISSTFNAFISRLKNKRR